jgi:putative ABC transport system permease protein
MKINPPKKALHFLRWFCREDYLEEIEGDLTEVFEKQFENHPRQAKWKFAWSVIKYFRPAFMKSFRNSYQLNSYGMLRNYFTTSWRNLLKNKSYSMINISGLAIGLACSIAIALYVWDEYGYDQFHTNYKNIYRIVEKQIQTGNAYDLAVTPGLLAPVLLTDFDEVQETCRIGRTWQSAILKTEGLSVETWDVLVVDNSFFSLFDFKLIKGNPKKALLGPDEIVISQSLAEKLFGANWETSNILGRQVEYNKNRILTLSGIVADSPTNSHIQFDVLLSHKHDELNSGNYNWNSSNYHTYIVLNPIADQKNFETKIVNYLFKYSSDRSISLALQPLSEIYLHSDFDFQTDWSKTGSIVYIRIFIAVGCIVLVIALFNFINLSTARAMNRAKEVGVRKVIGALQRQLVGQFLSEAFIVTLSAMCLALLLLQLALPMLNSVSDKSLTIPFLSVLFTLSLIVATFLISLFAGIYPAFYLASFKPAKVLKGVFAIRSGLFFRQSLIITQFTFSVMLIIGTIVIYKQLIFLQNKNLGFDKTQLINVFLSTELTTKASLLKNDLKNQSSIADATISSQNLVNVTSSTGNIQWEGKEEGSAMRLSQMNIDPNFLSTTGIKLTAGRNFNSSIASDTTSAYIINETAAKKMGWTSDQAIGKKLRFWDIDGLVIGVVKDFHFRPMTVVIEPMLFRYWPWEDNSALLIKVKANQVVEALTSIETIYKKYDTESAFQFRFIDQAIESQYHTEKNTARIILYFSILAIMISCLGLFGLAAYTAERRTREIGVRKVLGASVSNIVNLLSRDFIKLVLIAILAASPLSWLMVNQWLDNFAYKIDLAWWVFALSGLTAMGIALLTVSGQSIKAALMNPVNSLKSE